MAGRGRLNSLDLLPEDAADDVVWACQQLALRTRTTSDIHFEFNDRLEAKGIEGVSRSAFYRHAVNKAAAQREMQDATAMFAGIGEEFTAKDVDERTIILGEYLKTLVVRLSTAGGVQSTKDLMELARAYQATVSAQKTSSDRKRQLDADRARLEKATSDAVDKVAEAGHQVDKAALLKTIREDVYGMFEK